ncbi:glycoside hydrolase family 16 protein [Bradyrhizobium sp. INPA01-394B]|uniref:Glycoside hydrolase family 16 protein n=1 Tax=Bradyrhizobium campsiandrae TaxID=1729892 RepID=A0ABR7TXK5_9BRAD|nr:glycoside hydrolase family 16 protein [Bradyrhizobium campsiandrae]MBC9877368.1 glycoside hydrolase family 16 protein [Bradyrhizobium campsiandrae]MBC9976658.1 glycoside hydrolase family 16 protein [Bradyrhizobium campsiandrae]
MMVRYLQLSAVAAACFALGITLGEPADAATLQKLTWGNPDQAWGTRRSVTEADRKAIAQFRTGHDKPVFAADFTDPRMLNSDWLLQSDDYLKSCRRPENVVASAAGLLLRTEASTGCHARWSTGFMISRQHFGYGYYEASIKAADIDGLNNAFWLVTEDHFEIDVCEVHFPNIDRMTLHDNNRIDGKFPIAVGFDSRFAENFSGAFHDFGVLWTANDIVFAVDGEPVAAIRTNGSITGRTDIRFSTALMDYAGKIPDDPVGHDMAVRRLRVYAIR